MLKNVKKKAHQQIGVFPKGTGKMIKILNVTPHLPVKQIVKLQDFLILDTRRT